MASLKQIRRRITSVKNTQKITRAMKMVAAARLRRAQQNITQLRPYALEMLDVISSVAARAGEQQGDAGEKKTDDRRKKTDDRRKEDSSFLNLRSSVSSPGEGQRIG